MEGNSSIVGSPQRATEDAVVNKEVCQPVRGLALQNRTSEQGKVAECTEQVPNTEPHHLTYFCTFCYGYEHKDLSHWQSHEYYVHQESRHRKCPECFALEYEIPQSTHYDQFSNKKQPDICPGNSNTTNEHCQDNCKHNATAAHESYKQSFWGCGFCYDEKISPMQSWVERCAHVASHMREGKRKNDWAFTNLIKVLLRQPNISELWISYIHSLHGPRAKDQPEFHWVGTNGLCQKVLRELEIGLRSVDEQIQLVKMTYIMGANESTQPIDSLFSANWSLGPRDQNPESSCSSLESDTMSENETEGDSCTGVKLERSSQHETSTEVDDRRRRTKSSSSLRDIVSIKLLINRFRRLLPRESAERREIKAFSAPRFKKTDDTKCLSSVFFKTDNLQSMESHACRGSLGLDGKNEKVFERTLAISGADGGSTIHRCGSPEYRGNRIINSFNGDLKDERECTKQTLPNDINLHPIQSEQSKFSSDIAAAASSVIRPSVIVKKERDCLGSNPTRQQKTIRRKTNTQRRVRTRQKVKYIPSASSFGRGNSPQARVRIASIDVPNSPDAPLNRTGSGCSATSAPLARHRSASLNAPSQNYSKGKILTRRRPGPIVKPGRATELPPLTQSFSSDEAFHQPTSSFNLLTPGNSSPAASGVLVEGFNQVSNSYYPPQLYSSQQQNNTISYNTLSVADTGAAPDDSNDGAFAQSDLIDVTDNHGNFHWEDFGYFSPQSNAVVNLTSSDMRQPLALGKPSRNNTLSTPYSSTAGSSSLPVPDSSSAANSEIPVRNMTQSPARGEPLHNNLLAPSKKRDSSAIGSSLLGVTDSSFGVNERSSQATISKEIDEESLNKRQRTSLDTSDNDEVKRMLACPYYLRHPKKYMKERSCPGPGWPSVHRLKAHLYKCHERPLQCSRCSQCFRNEEERNTHQRFAEACHMRPLSIADGMSEEQKSEVKRKARAETEEDKWRRIWRILFPMDAEADIPKPYYPIHGSFGVQAAHSPELSLDCEFEEFLSRGFCNKVMQKIEMVAEKEDDFIKDKIKKHMVNIVQECTTELFQEFRQWKNSNNSNDASEVNACRNEVSQIDSTPTLSTGLSSEGGVMTGNRTPTQSPQQEQDEPASESCLQGLTSDPSSWIDCWPPTLEIDFESNSGAQYYGTGFTDIPDLL